MSRSRKKVAMQWLTKKWSRFKERAYRRRMHQVMHDIETDFDPDRDWEEANMNPREVGCEIGTKMGFEVKPHPDETDGWGEPLIGSYEKDLRK